jgi:hypothetical protein
LVSGLSQDVRQHEANKKLVFDDENGLISHLWSFTRNQTSPGGLACRPLVDPLATRGGNPRFQMGAEGKAPEGA